MLKTLIAAALVLILFFVIIMLIDNNRFVVRHYTVRSPKILQPLKVVFVADLHEKSYGWENESLIGEIERIGPDMILIGGDLVTSSYAFRHCGKMQRAGMYPDPAGEGKNDLSWMPNSGAFARAAAGICPTWIVKGNHELRLDHYEELNSYGRQFRRELESAGVRFIGNGHVDIDRSGLQKKEGVAGDTGIRLSGLELPERYYKKFRSTPLSVEEIRKLTGDADSGRFNILLTHSPVYFEQYTEWGADLCLCGHVHGGLMRLPLIGGVVGTRPNLFPRYSGGQYSFSTGEGKEAHAGTMILTCGLGMHTLPVRIFNPGEISVIELGPLNEKEHRNGKQEASWN